MHITNKLHITHPKYAHHIHIHNTHASDRLLIHSIHNCLRGLCRHTQLFLPLSCMHPIPCTSTFMHSYNRPSLSLIGLTWGCCVSAAPPLCRQENPHTPVYRQGNPIPPSAVKRPHTLLYRQEDSHAPHWRQQTHVRSLCTSPNPPECCRERRLSITSRGTLRPSAYSFIEPMKHRHLHTETPAPNITDTQYHRQSALQIPQYHRYPSITDTQYRTPINITDPPAS